MIKANHQFLSGEHHLHLSDITQLLNGFFNFLCARRTVHSCDIPTLLIV
ncbi:Uncharacterised protein [Vibrio cholerae]|nr:Uncharacterised protein [Vibrio cholerae]CSI49212.1 Uncharacterised protein [Vibrio cholerae]